MTSNQLLRILGAAVACAVVVAQFFQPDIPAPTAPKPGAGYDTVVTDARVKAILKRMEDLTPREAEVLALVVAGKLNKTIARELGISQRTVEIHRARVMEKMRARSVSELVQMVMKTGEEP